MRGAWVTASAIVGLLFDQIIKAKIAQVGFHTVLFSFGPFGIESLLNQNLFIWLPVPGVVMTVLSGLVLAGIVWFLLKFIHTKTHSLYIYPLVLVLAGGISNFIDRLSYGATIDYIRIGGLVGNIADILVVAGLVWLFIIIQKEKKHV